MNTPRPTYIQSAKGGIEQRIPGGEHVGGVFSTIIDGLHDMTWWVDDINQNINKISKNWLIYYDHLMFEGQETFNLGR